MEYRGRKMLETSRWKALNEEKGMNSDLTSGTLASGDEGMNISRILLNIWGRADHGHQYGEWSCVLCSTLSNGREY